MRARLAPGSRTAHAQLQRVELQLPLDAEHRVLEREGELHVEIAAALRPGPTTAPGTTERAAEEHVEDPAGVAEREEVRTDRRAARTEEVVLTASCGVRQRLVGRRDLLEAAFRVRVLVHIGMQLSGELAVAAL